MRAGRGRKQKSSSSKPNEEDKTALCSQAERTEPLPADLKWLIHGDSQNSPCVRSGGRKWFSMLPKNVKCENEGAQKKLTLGKWGLLAAHDPESPIVCSKASTIPTQKTRARKLPSLKNSNSHTTTPRNTGAGLGCFASKFKTPLWCTGIPAFPNSSASTPSPRALIPKPTPTPAPHSCFHKGSQLWYPEALPLGMRQEHCCSGTPAEEFTVLLPSEAEKHLLPPGYPASSTCRIQREMFWGPSLSYNLLLGCSQRKESSYQQAILCTIYTNTLHHKKVVCFLCSEKQECWVPCHASYFMREKERKK